MKNLIEKIKNNPHKFFDVIENTNDWDEKFIGFRLKNSHIFYWFKQYDENCDFYFDHSYNCNTGKIKKKLRSLPDTIFNILIN